jgi:DNA-binding response OmpR family regulator
MVQNQSILLVDNDVPTCDRYQKLLKRYGYHVEIVRCIDDAYYRAENTPFSLILIEVSLGHEDGTLLVHQLRALGISTPIVMFTNHDSEMFETAALYAGADDYILKASSIERLTSRLAAHIRREERREGRKPTTERRIPIGRLVLDRQARVLEGDDRSLKLTEKETAILDLLSRNPRHIFPISEVLERAWGSDFRKSEDALHAVLKRLRQKLEQEYGIKGLIQNYHGRGFRLAEQIVSQIV